MVTSNVQFSESGAASASISRKDVIGDENKLKKVEFTHIENPQVAALDSRQMANNTPSATRRSDEEIQVVFDRYKDALYRIYNRELRKNSLLKGKLVLKLTIEPGGKVSNCRVESSELNSEELEKKIIARVMRFNFGATVHRVVRMDIADGVFEPDTSELRLQWTPKIAQLIEELKKAPSVLRFSYLADVESPGLVRKRLAALKKTITSQWDRSAGDYRLIVETEIFWRRGAPLKGR
jgi:hypothetical protein